ncbi:CBS domain-containing protein [Puniceicoccaceae bacterium K14]|nr:CBS domain-containing protein [Puniceicoccaceae bacterium K14]
MTSPLVTVEANISPRDAVSIMRKNRIRRLIAVDEGNRLSGILCHRDLTRAAERVGTAKQVKQIGDIMNSRVITIGQSEPIESAARLMTKYHIGSLVVTQNECPVGIITESDIFRALTYLLTANGNSVRITFDITKNENILQYLVETAFAKGLKLNSFLTFSENERLLAIATISGDCLTSFIDDVWNSGHPIISVIDTC